MDKFGWVMIAQLIGVLDIKIEDLEQIVKEDNKQRFSLTVLRQKLEQVKVILPMLMQPIETKPPSILFHGTATRFLESIYKTGINKGKETMYTYQVIRKLQNQ
jgi:putative RNA 2'-phosphotransferase